jgi:hypothetical protein
LVLGVTVAIAHQRAGPRPVPRAGANKAGARRSQNNWPRLGGTHIAASSPAIRRGDHEAKSAGAPCSGETVSLVVSNIQYLILHTRDCIVRS